MTKTLSSLLFCGVLSCMTVANAEPGSRAMGGEFLLKDRVAEKLSLTDEQLAEIKMLTDNYRSVYPRDEGAREEHREAVKALMTAETFDETAARALLDENDDKQLAAMQLRFDIAKVLSDEQKAQLHEMKSKFGKHRNGSDKHRKGAGKRHREE